MEDGTTILFGLPGVAVDRVERHRDGRVAHVVTVDESAAACPGCGVFSTSVKQYHVTRPRDLGYGEEPLAVRWHKRQFRCRGRGCSRRAFTESIAELPPGARVTGRLRGAAGAAVDEHGSVRAAAAGHGISWPVVHAAFVGHADAQLVEPAPVVVLGIDETRRGRPRWDRDPDSGRWRRLDRFETNFVDLGGDGGLLGQTGGRTAAAVVAWLDARGEDWKAAVRIVAMDPCATYRRAVQDALPQARIVADHFHLVRLANDAVTRTRQRVTRDRLGRRGRRTDPAWANRRRLLRARERLSERACTRMWNELIDADPSGELLAAWIGKEELRALLATARRGRQRSDIAHRLHRFYDWCARVDVPELTTLAQTIDAWWPQVLGFLETGITNAGTEGVNRLIKDTSRAAFGFRNLDHQRRRVRFHCTRRQRKASANERCCPLNFDEPSKPRVGCSRKFPSLIDYDYSTYSRENARGKTVLRLRTRVDCRRRTKRRRRTAWFPSPAEGSPSIAPTRPRGSNAFHRDGGERDPGGGGITHGRLWWAVSSDSDASSFVPCWPDVRFARVRRAGGAVVAARRR